MSILRQASKTGSNYILRRGNSSLSSLEKQENQIANTQTRLDYVGEDTDRRNGLEKLLNLPQGQNVLFDVLNIMQRPWQAGMNVLNTQFDSNDNRSVSEAAKEGISGKAKKVEGSEWLGQAGFEGWQKHVGGFGIDVLLDPLTYIPGAQIAKGASMVGRGVKATTPAPVRNLAQKGSDVVSDLFKVDSQKLGRTLDGEFSPEMARIMQESQNLARFGNTKILSDTKDAAKTVGANSENFEDIGKQMGRIMEDALEQFDKVPYYKAPSGQIFKEKSEFKKYLKSQEDIVNKVRKGIQRQRKKINSNLAKALNEQTKIMSDIANNTLKRVKAERGLESGAKIPKKDRLTVEDLLNANKEYKKAEATYDALKNAAALERAALSATTKGMNKVITEVRQMLKKPLTEEVKIERIKEVASKDPELLKATEALTANNKWLVQVAKEKGIDIPTMAGYMAHVLTSDAITFMGKKVSSGKRKTGGNPNILNERKLKGSAEEINKDFKAEYGYDLFNPNAFTASALGQKRTLNYIIAESAKKEVLGNPEFARPLKKGEIFVPNKMSDEVLVRSSDFDLFKIDDLKASTVDTLAADGQQYIITKGAKRVLDQFQLKTQDEGIRNFVKAYDKVHSGWKKLALFSAGFHIRNHMGNNFNMWIAGMTPADLLKYQNEAHTTITNAKNGNVSKHYDNFLKQGLREASIFEQEFTQGNAEKALARSIGVDKSKNPIPKAFDASRDLGTYIDEHARFGLYKWALDKGKAKTPEEAASLVREVLFDYGKLTEFEKGVKRVIPFYTWMRNNIPFQLKNLFLQPKKYSTMEKGRQMAFGLTGIEQETSPEWLEESFAFPVYGDGTGDGKFLGLNLPLADISQLSNPFKMLVDSASPLIKTPIEFGANYDLFRGQPLEQFEGEKGNIGGLQVPKKAAHVINQLGAVRNFANHTGRAQKGDWLNIITGNMLKGLNSEQATYFKNVETLQELQDALARYKQEYGELPPTLAEIGR
jgi:hypothetical protein